eukprot:CAMPEP_0179162654 /NCGR_PEP_ID=MMETSP0796-20121207/79691_1 /TAXON_ID=73915 /ORGANISM="Pyrodinium bahamense, Strain pbaha01" /LENGTH=71 /DNA_ID=CAMNT_0020864871 /DNA_START=174 /DNA_END=386 /DNA_ORIENTATION=-
MSASSSHFPSCLFGRKNSELAMIWYWPSHPSKVRPVPSKKGFMSSTLLRNALSVAGSSYLRWPRLCTEPLS